MSNRVSTPFPIYSDTDGSPLDAGFIFIGVGGRNPITSPLAVFYDAALTMPAENPLKTRNGYITKNGALREIFTAEPIVSILVRNKRGVDVWNAAFINLNPGITPSAVIDPITKLSQEDINATILEKSKNLSDLPNKDQSRENLDVYSTTEVDEKFTTTVKDATEEVKGIIRIATSSEAKAGDLDTVAITPKKMPEATAKALSAAGEAPVFGIRAYGTFDGTGEKISGGNFESAAKIENGVFEVTLTKAMNDTKYTVIPSMSVIGGATEAQSVNNDDNFDKTTTKFRFRCTRGGDNAQGMFNPDKINFIVLG